MVHYSTRYKYNSREPVSSPRDVILIKLASGFISGSVDTSSLFPCPNLYSDQPLYIQHFVSDEDPNGYTRISVLV